MRCIPFLFGVGLLLACLVPLAAQDAAEKDRIEGLLKHVQGLKAAKFVRNNQAYDASAAVTFLRRKWQAEAAKVKTAEDFIDKVATASSLSGQPYLIRFADGKEVKSGEYLREILKKGAKNQ